MARLGTVGAMTSTLSAVNIDCHRPLELAAFWAEVLGYVEGPDAPSLPGDVVAFLRDPKGLLPDLIFETVPEDKVVKNRVHLDLDAEDRLRDAEVERVVALGATVVADRREPDGTGWVVLADPEGNEFCVLSPRD